MGCCLVSCAGVGCVLVGYIPMGYVLTGCVAVGCIPMGVVVALTGIVVVVFLWRRGSLRLLDFLAAAVVGCFVVLVVEDLNR